ncbi:sporulation integral membrane protein YlbJ [Alkalicoccobacillus porphyridii]|uniref:Sporulation integral membrane protein YlbJ n=1 Tax=Alkalicoccobacillus porphyridii TaxID=2597270 RepID=A0A553ZXY0_9BACI|nr:sporulation integral membrane protein YlbJ [Alkalicoccobacillus porphyridii]TSB46308.1 sporulation integral membrane protein YlbJ [Alkalicoccobacillus porphyridii]
MSLLKTWLLAAASSLLAVSLILFPKEALEASLNGMAMWWNVVFPALLPFFILSELLIGFGVVAFIGTFLEPFMRPVFRVPGAGGFVWAMGLASGNPAGAKLAARLRQEGTVSRIEGERLAAFTNSSNPLFIFGAIAVGFFHNEALGLLLACAHYGGNIAVGLIMRFYGRKEEMEIRDKRNTRIRFSFAEAVSRMHDERMRDERPIGKQLGDAVQSSVRTLLMVGGFIILFSVLNEMLSLIGFTAFIATFISILFSIFQLSSELSIPLLSGLFEITSGAKLSSSSDASLIDKIIVTSFFVAFGGLSIQAQVASILSETDLRFKPFFIGRLAHGLLSALLAWILWEPLYQNRTAIHTSNGGSNYPAEWFSTFWSYWLEIAPYVTLATLLLVIWLTSRALLRSS